GAGGGSFLPVAKQLLPGPPADFPELMTWTSFPVADAWYSKTAYWFCVPRDHRVIRDKRLKIEASDYLLIETAANWTSRLEGVTGRLCTLRVPSAHGSGIILACITSEREEWEPGPKVETFGQVAAARLLLESESRPFVELPWEGIDFTLQD